MPPEQFLSKMNLRRNIRDCWPDALLMLLILAISLMIVVALTAAPLPSPRLAIAPVPGTTNITLRWNAQTNSLVAGVRIYCWPSINGVSQFTVPGNTATSYTITNLSTPGAYSFMATTFSSLGAESVGSDQVMVHFPIRLFTVTFAGPSNSSYNIQSSGDLKQWSAIQTNKSGSNSIVIIVGNTNSQLFFRAQTNS